jgi:AraC family transcriptional regulator
LQAIKRHPFDKHCADCTNFAAKCESNERMGCSYARGNRAYQRPIEQARHLRLTSRRDCPNSGTVLGTEGQIMLLGPSFSSLESQDIFERFAESSQDSVSIHPSDAVTRRLVSWKGMAAEVVEAIRHDRIAACYRGDRHLFVMCDQGVRHAGETLIEGLLPSTLRDVARKLSLVPAGHKYCDWHEPRVLPRMLYFYLDPKRVQTSRALAPRMLFEDPAIYDMATRLSRLVQAAGSGSPYFEALGTVLAYELFDTEKAKANSEGQAKGGLAPWQQREVTTYIEEHLGETISLSTLARLAELSRFHFSRAFKRSLGVSPLRYHARRRMENAKRLLASPSSSVTEVGLTVGYRETSSFTAAFHKATGLTPTEYRRRLPRISQTKELQL